jgi:hypothetical protein
MNRVQNSMLMLIAFSMFALLAVNLTAQEASPQPKEVFAYYYSQDKTLGIEWIIEEKSEVITGFNCTIQKFEADSTLKHVLDFEFSINDENLFHKGDLDGWEYFGYFNTNIMLEPGMYELTLKSISQNGESLPSLSTYLWYDEGENKTDIYFTVFPEMYATVGKLYQSYIKAESYNNDKTIKYSLTEAPQGMTIDEDSGLIKFTPTESGNPYFVVRATNADDANEYMEMYLGLVVVNCENLATLTGKITYDESVENKTGYVLAYQIAADGSIFQSGGIDVYEEGDFNIQLDKGSYYIYFMLFDKFDDNEYFNMGEWYKDALTMQQAELITVDCGETVSIVMLVGDQIEFTRYKVSGTVTLNDGTALPNSIVVFESVNSDNDSTFWGGYHKSVETDENGYYEVLLPDLFTYTAFCFVGETKNPGAYRPQYWKNTYNPFEAKVIELKADVSGIDFIFNEDDINYPDGSISGKVMNTDDTPIEGAFVIAFMVKSFDGKPNGDLYQGFAAITDDEGEYKFEYMNYGEYILFAYPNDANYTPGFYRENEVAALTWDEASIIMHDGFTPLKQRNIILPLMEAVQGFAKIEGEVTSTGGGIRNDKAGDAISGASIFLVNESGATNKYNKSSTNGTYRLTGIAAGRYQLIVDKVGYRSHKEWVEVGEDGVLVGHDIQLSPESLSSVKDNNTSLGLNVFPNPATSQIQLTLNSTTNNLTVEVYNMIGVKILNQSINSVIGSGTYSLDVSDLNSGMYILKVIDGQNITIDKIIINR